MQDVWTTPQKLPQVQQLTVLGKRLRQNNDLVIGISPWGSRQERIFLEAAKGAYDIILGGGPGKGMRGNMDISGSVLWARGFAKGKMAAVIDLLVWPRRQPDWEWFEGFNVRFPLVPLDHTIPSAPKTLSILSGSP